MLHGIAQKVGKNSIKIAACTYWAAIGSAIAVVVAGKHTYPKSEQRTYPSQLCAQTNGPGKLRCK
jgi:hypothetical protein